MDIRSQLEALALEQPEVSSFLKSIPLSQVWLVSVEDAEPVTADRILPLFCHHECSLSASDLRTLNAAIRKAAGPIEQLITASRGNHRHQIWIKSVPLDVGGVRHSLIAARDISIEHKLEESLKSANRALQELEFSTRCSSAEAVHLALNDPLTGLPNRRAFDTELGRVCRRGAAAVCLMDMDRFKQVNDSLGHAVGDKLLVAVAQKLRTHTRGKDFVARLAGDEFAIIFNDITSESAAFEAVERLLSTFRSRLDLGDVDIQASLSGGAAVVEPGDDPQVVYRRADLALHKAKDDRRGTLTVHSMDAQTLGEHDDLVVVKSLLSERRVPLGFEPVIDAQGRVIAHEITVGGRAGQSGRAIEEVFSTAEKFGLGSEFVAAVLKEVCDAVSMRPESEAVHLRLPSAAFSNLSLSRQVASALEDAGLPASALYLEVPFSASSDEAARDVLADLRAIGVPLIFGEWDLGLAALRHLKGGFYAMVKFDAQAVVDVAGYPHAAVLSRAAVELVSKFGVSACGRGADGSEEAQMLFGLGVSAVQGRGLVKRDTSHNHSVTSLTSAA